MSAVDEGEECAACDCRVSDCEGCGFVLLHVAICICLRQVLSVVVGVVNGLHYVLCMRLLSFAFFLLAMGVKFIFFSFLHFFERLGQRPSVFYLNLFAPHPILFFFFQCVDVCSG